jgi:hypothetical protein
MDQQIVDPSPTNVSRSRLALWFLPLCLAILASLTFSTGLTGAFVLDDNVAITDHPVVQDKTPLADAFRLNFWGRPLGEFPPAFRPLATLSFALDHRLMGNSALGFHISSLLWYIGLVLAAWAFARRCIGPWAAWIALAFFVAMPVHVENVTSIVGRADTLGVLSALLSMLAVAPTIISGKETSPSRLLLAALAFMAALLCKEGTVVLPIVVALFVEYRRQRQGSVSHLKAHLPSLTLSAVLGLYVIIRLRLQPDMLWHRVDDDVLVGASFPERIGYGLELLARYSGLVAAPSGLCTGRKFAEVFRPQQISLLMAIGVALLGFVGYLSWRAYRRGDPPHVLAALVSWFVVSGLVLPMPESMADRFLLLPSLFMCFALGPAMVSLWRKGLAGRGLLVTALTAQVVLSMGQARTWHDDGSLLSHAVLACPDSLHNHFRYAEYLSRTGQTAEAVWHYAVLSKGRHAFPYAWSHPAKREERALPVEERLRAMHRLLGFTIDEQTWRERFAAYLLYIGKSSEARLVVSLGSQQ